MGHSRAEGPRVRDGHRVSVNIGGTWRGEGHNRQGLRMLMGCKWGIGFARCRWDMVDWGELTQGVEASSRKKGLSRGRGE